MANETNNKILTIEDDDIVRESIAAYLEDSGFIVLQADNGPKGLELFRHENPDIILVDLRMPQIDGLEILATATKESPETPIIVVSGKGDRSDAIEALHLGAWDYISKPIEDMVILEHATRKALERARLMRENRRYREHLEEEIKKRTSELHKELSERRRAEDAIRYRVGLEKLVTSISTNFINLTLDEIDNGIQNALQSIGEFTSVDRIYVFLFYEKVTNMDMRYEWVAEGIERQINNFKGLNVNAFPWLMEKLNLFEPIHISHVSELPLAAAAELDILQLRTIKSWIAVPIVYGGSLTGFLGFVSIREEKTWMEEDIALLKTVGDIFVNALERKKAEEMKASERLKSEFLTNITHEFRTPLTLAMGPLEEVLFGGDRTIEKPLREQLELSFRNIRKLLQLINQLLEFSRLEAGATVLNYQKSNLKDFVSAIIEFFSSIAESKKIKTVFMHHKEDYTACIDPEKMDKVLVNVIGNAFKFTPEGGIVEIRCQVVKDRSQMSEVQRHNVDTGKAYRDYIEIIVKDSGIGIKSEELGKIFERFHQANGTVSSGAGGTGIGLSLAKELLELQGGIIDVESIYGQGTTFTIRLPKGEDHIKDKNLIRRENGEIEVPHCTKEYVDLIKLEEEDKEETIKSDRPLILVVDDNQDVRRYIKSILKRKYEVISANDGLEAWKKLQRFTPSLIISDIMMPKMDGYQLCQQVKSSTEFSHIPFVFLTAKTEIEMKISGLEEGADEYIVKPFSSLELMARVKSLLKNRELVRENLEKEDRIFSLTHELEGRYHYQNIVGQAKVMQKVFQIMESIKKADHPVLITGETGTGKELIAKSLHYISLRKGKPFIVQNCSAFSEHLLESEIFGHVRGAFTGAIQDKRGLFELADGGTLFLDEIGDLSSNTQAKLLRVIENGAFYPLGGVKEKKVDIRLITATNKDLKALLKEGTFREDLYYRLNVINIDLPPLRDRKEDIPLLIEYFLDDISEMYTKKKHISSQALKYLMEYSYPGNIRELRNIVEKSYLLCSGMTIRPKNLPQEIWDERKEAPTKAEPIDKMLESVQRLERQTIIEALKQTKRNKTKAAKILNISIPTLFKRIKQCKINLESI